MKNQLIRPFLAFLLFALISPAEAGEYAISAPQPAMKLKVGSVAPSGTPWAGMLEEIARIVSKESNSNIALEIGYGGAFGGEGELLQKCREGKIAIVGVSSTIASELAPELGIIELPYLFNSFDEIDFILDEVLFPIVSEKLAEKDLVLLMWAENGFKNIASNRQVHKPGDLKGMRIRCQKSPVYYEIFKNFGADPVALSIREVARGLQSGVLEGFDNTPLFTYSSGLYHHIKTYTLTQHTYQPILFMMSKKVYDGLNSDQKSIFKQKVAERSRAFRENVRVSMLSMQEKLKENGIQVIQLTDQEKEAFRNGSQSVYKNTGRLLGAESEKLFGIISKALVKYRSNKKY